jgi:nucleotide-binding universal stress UspA family protein
MTGAMIWLLHVIPPHAYASIEAGAYPFFEEEKEYRAAEAALSKVALELREKNLPCTYEVRRWYPVDEIKACIRDHGIDRLIVGTSSRGKLGKFLIGSRGVNTQFGDSRLHGWPAFLAMPAQQSSPDCLCPLASPPSGT